MDGGAVEILVSGLQEGIGIALDVHGGRMFFTDLGGNVYSARMDGSGKKVLLAGVGSLTGIAYVKLPASATNGQTSQEKPR